MKQYKMYIDGAWLTGDTALEVINPATGETFATCDSASADHVEQAVAAARRAFPAWRDTPDDERRAKCVAIAGKLQEHAQELATLLTLETGKPLGGLNGVGSNMELGGAIGWTQYTASLDLPVDVLQDDEAARIEVHRKPLGVVASILPWNWPLMIAVWHILPALRAGNTVVLKPSPFAPVTISRFIEIIADLLPVGVVNLVNGAGEIGAAIASHPDINKVVFTGSTESGRKVMVAGAANLKRLTLELGGNDAGIVLPDVDIKSTAPALFGACFHNSGQTCAAIKRLYVHESHYDALCEEFSRIASEVVVGDGMDPETDLGPVQNIEQYNKVMGFIESARAEGGRIIAGGNAVKGPGYFIEPTVVSGLREGSKLVDEEPFGPIIPLIKYSSVDEAVSRANKNDKGLGGSVWSTDVKRAQEIAHRMECGTVWINDHGSVQPNMPFGGVKQSGLGVEFGTYGLEEYTSLHSIKINRPQ